MAPWDLEELPYEWVDAAKALTDRYPSFKKAKDDWKEAITTFEEDYHKKHGY